MSIAQTATVVSRRIGQGKSVWVDATNGNDTTGLRGRQDRPFATLIAAQAAALSGDWIRPAPQNHNIGPQDALGKAGVHWNLAGVTITKTGTLTDATTIKPWFDLTNITCKILGYPDLFCTLHDNSNVSGGQSVNPILIAGSANVFLRIGSIPDASFGTSSVGSIKQTNGTADIDLVQGNYLQTNGTLNANFATTTFVQQGSSSVATIRGSVVEMDSAGTVGVQLNQAAIIVVTGGSLQGNIVAADYLDLSAGKVDLVCGAITSSVNVSGTCYGSLVAGSCLGFFRSGTNTANGFYVRVTDWGAGLPGVTTGVCIGVSANTDVLTVIEGGTANYSAIGNGFAWFRTGKVLVKNFIGINTATGGTGERMCMAWGDTTPGNLQVLDVTLIDCELKVSDPDFYCAVIASESNILNKFTIKGGRFQGGANVTWLGTEADRTVNFDGVVTANSLLPTTTNLTITPAGPGAIIVNPSLSL